MADRPRPSCRGEIPRQYPPELKQRAVRLVAETIAEQGGQRHGAVGQVAAQLGVGPESFRHWVAQAEIYAGTRPGLSTADRERIRELERENFEVRRANEILKSAALSSGRSSTAARRNDPLQRRAPPLV
jgi:transposase